MIINGLPDSSLIANDRGLMYGDGVFRTLLVKQGKALHWPQHYNKIQHDCIALGIPCPSMQTLADELTQLTYECTDGVLKIIITRGPAKRGYAPEINPNVSRIISIHPLPEYPVANAQQGVKVHLCHLRLGHQPRLAGIKHLNRLENVLAAAEWNAAEIAEGILLDQDEKVIEGTRSNLFMVRDGNLITPDLSRCGVAGLQRDRVMDLAEKHGMTCTIGNILIADLFAADEIFLVNTVIGLWPIREMPGYKCQHFPVSLQIQAWLNNEIN